VNIQDWQSRNDEARLKDLHALHARLQDLESNQNHLKEILSMFVFRFIHGSCTIYDLIR
jgi:hypothetical protein